MAAMANVSTCRYCAFCKYWWDPTFKFIYPHIGTQWYYEPSGKCRCIKKGIDMPATTSCNNFRCKVDW